MSALVTWIGIGALLALALIALAGCAVSAPPPYLCVAGRLDNGTPAMLCNPLEKEMR